MSFFDDDPFEDIVKEFFGEKRKRKSYSEDFISGEEEERNIDFIETKDKFFVVFELPGYDEKDIHLEIKGNKLNISASKKCADCVENYMKKRLGQGIKIVKSIPQDVKTKKYNYTVKNGVLEISFEK